MNAKAIEQLRKDLDIFCCPKCGGRLDIAAGNLTCADCKQSYQVSGGIPLLFWPNEWDAGERDVTEKIKEFYEENPFPDYDDFDDAGSLIAKSRRGIFARLLDDQVPYGAKILECGCGTGQLSNFLSIANRRVFGSDICLNSLKMAREFKKKNDLENASFLQMNLFRPCFKPGSFDLVISNGVLHHTSDPFAGFRVLSRLVKPKGYILIGLYHRYGRVFTDIRRLIFRIPGRAFKFLDRRIIDKNISASKRRAWFMDQYRNPHESKHTIGEVLGWLGKTGLIFIKSIPKTRFGESFRESEKLFKADKPGGRVTRFLVEFSKVFTGSREGGFFIIIAKKP